MLEVTPWIWHVPKKMANLMQHRLLDLFEMIKKIRLFFEARSFVDVLTPAAVENPGMETHLHPFQLYSVHQKKLRDLYLHTSPEFAMKKLLAEGMEKIFTLSYCFRDEPESATHRPQFLMLEWYRKDEPYEKIMEDVEQLIEFCSSSPQKVVRKTVAQVFQEILEVDLFTLLEKASLVDYLKNQHSDLALEESFSSWSWDDCYFFLFLNKIEPELKRYPYLILYEFPAQLAALSKISAHNPLVCQRFELYIDGVEIANCFHEETQASVIAERFSEQALEKKRLYHYQLPEAREFRTVMENGYPPSSGIALGVERFAMALTKRDDLFWKPIPEEN